MYDSRYEPAPGATTGSVAAAIATAEGYTDSQIAAQHTVDLTTFVTVGEYPPTIQQFFQIGDTDWTAAFNRAAIAPIDALLVPPSTTPYDVSATIDLPYSLNLTIAEGATVRAVATIAGPIFRTPLADATANIIYNGGGTINCNFNAETGLALRFAQHTTLENLAVFNATGDSIIIGDPAAAGSSFELIARNLSVTRTSTGVVPSGSRGLWMRRASDSELSGLTIVGSDIGIRDEQGANHYHQAHVWGYAGHLPSLCFDDVFGSAWSQCSADSPTIAGWHFRGGSAQLSDSRVLLATSQVDNTVTGAIVDSGVVVAASGNTFLGGNGGTRLAADWTIANPDTVVVIAQRTLFAVTSVLGGNAFGSLVPPTFFGAPIMETVNVPGAVTTYPAGQFIALKHLHVMEVVSFGGSGSGATFHLEHAGTPLTAVMNVGDATTVSFNMAALTNAYLVFNNVGIGVTNVTVGILGYVQP